MVLENIPENNMDKKVAYCYMDNFADIDIRIELRITKKCLMESRERLKEKINQTAKQFAEIKAAYELLRKIH